MQDKISLALPEDGKRKWEAGENQQGGEGGRKPNINKVSQLWLFSTHIVGRENGARDGFLSRRRKSHRMQHSKNQVQARQSLAVNFGRFFPRTKGAKYLKVNIQLDYVGFVAKKLRKALQLVPEGQSLTSNQSHTVLVYEQCASFKLNWPLLRYWKT